MNETTASKAAPLAGSASRRPPGQTTAVIRTTQPAPSSLRSDPSGSTSVPFASPSPIVVPNNQVAQGDNRVNPIGRSLGTVKSRTSLYYTNIVPAGQTLQVPAAGTQFYVTYCTTPISIKPSGGVFNVYYQGTGLQLLEINSFDLLEIRNDSGFDAVVQVFVGFDQYIDNRLILTQNLTPTIAFPTYPTPNAATNVNINDLSASLITDINGNKFYALYRINMNIFNADGGVTLLLQKSGGTGTSPAIGVIYPLTTLTLPMAGNYTLNVGGGNVNAVVSEMYACIPKT